VSKLKTALEEHFLGRAAATDWILILDRSALRLSWDRRTKTQLLPSWIIRDDEFVAEVEGKIVDTDVVVVSPDLSNVGDRSDFSDMVANVVLQNTRCGITYTYVCPEGGPGVYRVQRLKARLKDVSSNLRLCEIPRRRFDEISLLPAHMIVFTPRDPQGVKVAYMQLPTDQRPSYWIKLDNIEGVGVISKVEQLINQHASHTLPVISCECLGDDQAAAKYLLGKYSHHSPPTSVRDTHSLDSRSYPAQKADPQKPQAYWDLWNTFSNCLKSGKTEGTFIVGWTTDIDYIQALQKLQETTWRDKITVYRLRQPGPAINFIIVDYLDSPTEVLFGWGRNKSGSSGLVFRSTDPLLVSEFSNVYEYLQTLSENVWNLGSLSTLPQRDVPCHFVGDSDAGLAYVLDRMQSKELIGLKDIHGHRAHGAEFGDYERWKTTLTAFLDRNGTHFTEIVCPPVDMKLMQEISNVQTERTKTGKSKNITRLILRGGSSPIMNFIILKYVNRSDEVLFGWGRYVTGEPNAVFRSNDEILVEEFGRLYEALRSRSKHLESLEELLREQGEYPWLYDLDRLDAVESKAQDGSTIYLITPDLYNDATKARTRNVVIANHKRNITYRYITRNDIPATRIYIQKAINVYREYAQLSYIYVANDLFKIPFYNVLIIDSDELRVFIEIPHGEGSERPWWSEADTVIAGLWFECAQGLLASSEEVHNPHRKSTK
jgi:hypothetical protein